MSMTTVKDETFGEAVVRKLAHEAAACDDHTVAGLVARHDLADAKIELERAEWNRRNEGDRFE